MEATVTFTVSESDTAEALGSGSLPVLATPRVLAWVEAASCAALDPELAVGSTSVGTRVSLEHLAPCAVGTQVSATATEVYADGSLRRFSVVARSGSTTLAAGEVTRVIVDVERFMSRVR
ncbi:MAG: thioesterase family protein [Nocardioides sp.]